VLIRTNGLWKIYEGPAGKRVDALQDISIDIESGCVTAIGGASGSGKTTLLSLIGLLSRPTRGQVSIDGKEVSTYSEVYRTSLRKEWIGFIFQAQYLLPHLTAVENVALPMICTDMEKETAENKARNLLISLNMQHRLAFRVAELSGGEQQRVSIARALINNPKILIADEPSSSIDEELTDDLLASLKEMTNKDGLTVVVASHDKKVIEWADHLFVLKDGKLISES